MNDIEEIAGQLIAIKQRIMAAQDDGRAWAEDRQTQLAFLQIGDAECRLRMVQQSAERRAA